MYEQYTDKQIVEMLVPKLNKSIEGSSWGGLIRDPERHKYTIKAFAIIYRLAYIRGQLGHSFIVDEEKVEKTTEQWVPATKDNVKVWSKVRYLNAEKHEQSPEFYPLQGTIGEVISVVDDNTYLVQWPDYTAAWFANQFDLEVLLRE